MIELIKENRQTLEALCRNYHVARLEVFGSAATGRFDDKTSDLDFLVEFLPLQEGQYADAYFGLLFALQELFSRSVDLVMPEAIQNRYFLQSINQHRETLYAA
jgi:predicted nucleotidyltransferase